MHLFVRQDLSTFHVRVGSSTRLPLPDINQTASTPSCPGKVMFLAMQASVEWSVDHFAL